MPGTPVSRICKARSSHDRRTHGVGRGLDVSLSGLCKDQLVQRQIRHCSSETIVLSLQLFESLHLIALQGTVLVSSSIVRDFRHAYRSDRVCDLPALCHQQINLPKLRNDLFSRMPLSCHRSIFHPKIILQGEPLDDPCQLRLRYRNLTWNIDASPFIPHPFRIERGVDYSCFLVTLSSI